MQVKENIAIIFFSRNAAQESKCKQLVPANAMINQQVSSALIAKTKLALEASGLPVYHFTGNNQKGATFGEKLTNAYKEVFNLGYNAVIAVGNDSPELHTVDWNLIKKTLLHGHAVIGPTLRGGTYLIGLTSKIFNEKDFASLPWKSANLFNALHNYCIEQKSKAHILDCIRDINTFFDLRTLAQLGELNTAFKRFIRSILSFKTLKSINWSAVITISPLPLGSPFRAPPVAC